MYMTQKMSIFALLGFIQLCFGQNIDIDRRQMSYVENHVLEKVRKPIIDLVETQAKRQCKVMNNHSDTVDNIQQEVSVLKKSLKVLQTLMSDSRNASSQLNYAIMDSLRSEISEANSKLYLLMGRMIDVQERQSSQENLYQQLRRDTDKKSDSTRRQIGILTANISSLKEKVDSISIKPRPAADCNELFLNGHRTDGIYSICPDKTMTFNVYCDLKEGGWTLLQRRVNGSESFNRTWQEYVDGFGDLNGEFWLGLDKIHILTVNHRKVMFDFQLMSDKLVYIWYWYFSVGNATTDYTLRVNGYVSGLRERTFGYNNGQKFATYDRDNEHNCGKRRYGGWWYDHCTWLNINGQYNLTNSETGMTEHCCGASYNNFKKTTMKIQ